MALGSGGSDTPVTPRSVALFCCLSCKPAFVLQAWPAHLVATLSATHTSWRHAFHLSAQRALWGAGVPADVQASLNNEAQRLAWERQPVTSDATSSVSTQPWFIENVPLPDSPALAFHTPGEPTGAGPTHSILKGKVRA